MQTGLHTYMTSELHLLHVLHNIHIIVGQSQTSQRTLGPNQV